MEQLTLSWEEAPAKPSPSREEDAASWTKEVASCSSTSELFEKFVRAGCSGRTSPEFFRSRAEMLSLRSTGSWQNADSLAWRVLDAQFAGVAQRRRRVFLVGHSDPGRAAAVLFERERLRWDSPSSRDKRKELAAAAGRGSAGSCFGILGNVCDRSSTQNGSGVSEDVAPTLNTVDRHAVSYDGRAPGAAIAFSAGQSAKSGSVAAHAEVAPTLRAGSSGTNQVPTICFNHSASGSRGLGESVELSPTLRSSPGNCSNMPSVCMASGQANAETMEGCSPTLTRRGRKDSTVVTSGYCVRRLTPVECERLQGFPDGWTAIPWRGNPVEECPDTPRYKALGNSMAVPVMRWIGRSIQFVDGIEQ